MAAASLDVDLEHPRPEGVQRGVTEEPQGASEAWPPKRGENEDGGEKIAAPSSTQPPLTSDGVMKLVAEGCNLLSVSLGERLEKVIKVRCIA